MIRETNQRGKAVMTQASWAVVAATMQQYILLIYTSLESRGAYLVP
jgi:hypothetical protein